MDAGVEAVGADEARVSRFRRRGRWAIWGFLAVFAACTLVYRSLRAEAGDPMESRIIGETFGNVFLYFGPPLRESDDGRGGRVEHYREFLVAGGQFEEREFRIFVNADGRVYKFERD